MRILLKLLLPALALFACAQKPVDYTKNYWDRQEAIKEGDEYREVISKFGPNWHEAPNKQILDLDNRPFVRVSSRNLGVTNTPEQLKEKCEWARGDYALYKPDKNGFVKAECSWPDGDKAAIMIKRVGD